MVAALRKNSLDPVVLLREGKFKKALKLLERMAKKNALDFNMRMRLAEAYQGAGRPEDAAAVYKAEAESRFAGGDRAIGITLLKKAVKALPDDEALVKRLKELEGGDNGSAGSASFSFDIGADETGSFDAADLSGSDEPDRELEATEDKAARSDLGESDGEIATAPEELGVEAGDVIKSGEELEAGKSEDQVASGLSGEEAKLPMDSAFEAAPEAEVEAEPNEMSIEKSGSELDKDRDEAPNMEDEPVNEEQESAEVSVEEGESEFAGDMGEVPEAEDEPVEEDLESAEAPGGEVAEGAIGTGDELEEDSVSGDVSIDEPETEPQEAGTEGEREDLLEIPNVPAEIEGESEETFSAKGDAVDEVGAEPPVADEGDLEEGATLGGIDSEGLALLAELFPSLESGDLDFIHEMVERRTLAGDEILLREGDEGDSFYIVSKGRFAVYGTFEGNEMQLAELTPGSVIGEVSFLRSVPRTATVTALEESEVLELSPAKLSSIDSDDRAFKERLEAILNERIDRTIAMLKEKRGEENVET